MCMAKNTPELWNLGFQLSYVYAKRCESFHVVTEVAGNISTEAV